ncbi:MAG: glycosyltransferase family 1 protein [Anaerolineae bacterium]|nr:glycosyltransferase family 1 protein [Anaerolineae bacterium]
MRITITTVGTRGDVQPFVALGKGLQAAGHDVLLCTHRIFADFVAAHGLELYPIEMDPREMLVDQNVAEFGNDLRRQMAWFREHYGHWMAVAFEMTLAVTEQTDFLLTAALNPAAYSVAQYRKLPVLTASLQPTIPTRAFHSFMSPPPPAWLPCKGLYNYASTKLSNQMFFGVTRPLVNRQRADQLGLPPLGWRYYWQIDTGPTPLLYGYSPAVLPKPDDWDAHKHVCGYWFLDDGVAYEPPADLRAFLAAGPPPVYIGFGSNVEHEAEAITRLIVAAVELAGVRAVLAGGWSGLGATDLPDTILPSDGVPHDWLFPRMAALVHHGGAGTTAEGLRAGVPGVVVPFYADQPFWGWVVERLGVGPSPIPRQRLTAEALAHAIRIAVTHGPLHARAADLGARIRAEDGVAEAIRLIEHYAAHDRAALMI